MLLIVRTSAKTTITAGGVIGVIVWVGYKKLTAHMRNNPEAAKLIAEHVIAPLLMGREPEDKEEMKKTKGTLD